MLRCLSAEQIEQLLTGQADPVALELMESHLKACPRCRHSLASITDVSDAGQWQVAAQPSEVAQADDREFLDRLKKARDPQIGADEGRIGTAADANDLIGLASDNGVRHRQVVRRNPHPIAFPNVPGFEILSELGRGGMGVVYKARQTSQDRIVALKMIQAGLQASEEDLGRFADEADAIARLRHPHIVQILEVGQFDGRLFFVLEFVEGGTLYEQIRNKPLHPRSAAQLLESLARAMHFAHQRDIIHRDLKPANVLLHTRRAFVDIPSEAGQRPTDWDFRRFMPKITDFGLAKLLDKTHGHTASGDVVGTPSYMAPEQALGKPYPIRPSTDIYSLGAILYEMLTGKPPFLGPTPMDTLFQVHTQEPVPPRKIVRQIPPSLETICLKCLRKDPVQRYQTAEELAEDLRLSLDGLPIQARGSNAIRTGWKSLRRKTGTLFFAILALLTATLAGGTIVFCGESAKYDAAKPKCGRSKPDPLAGTLWR